MHVVGKIKKSVLNAGESPVQFYKNRPPVTGVH
jgi:hypothetical protein